MLTKYNINGKVIAVTYSRETLANKVAAASSVIKSMCGIANNAAWACCLEAMDALRQHPNYRHRVKKSFNDAMEEFKAYERNLIYAERNRLFHVADLTPQYRKRYGDITDREYYEYWSSTGATAYYRNKGWVLNLWNKYRISLLQHKVPHEEQLAWAMTACATLRLAECVYDNELDVCVEVHDVPKELISEIFGGLNVQRIADRWQTALTMLEPKAEDYELDEDEQKNIQFGLDQLMECWTSEATICNALTETTEAYGEVFRTQGEQKKALRMIAQMRC